MTTNTKHTTVICPYCGKPYTAKNSRVKYGCPNYECTVKAEREQREYHNNQARQWHKRKRLKKESTAKS